MTLALVVSLLAGLATSIGGLLVLNSKTLERQWLAVSLAFAAGAMIIVSLVELVPLGIEYMGEYASPKLAQLYVWLAFFGGIALVLVIDRILPDVLNPNEMEGREDALTETDTSSTRNLMRSGALVAMVLALHNFPEGMATFFTTYQDPQVGFTLAVAIAIHNVPEGIAVAAPVYAATGSKKKGFWWATFSGLTEPIGALFAALLVAWVIPPQFFGIFYGVVSGMMVFLALDELLPGAWRYQTDKHQTIYGMLAGMGAMAVSFVLFASGS
ncbi:zinc transporter ZupT [Actinomycetaceae bacterium MB13-C1-2]|nr:zinc transporter ZupT [Actinomycetaceae bacterium MB13-C1-2]